MRRVMTFASLLAAGALVLSACGDAPADSPSAAPSVDFQACMVSDAGGIDDKSFNQSAWLGLQNAETDLGVQSKFVESKTDADYAPNINSLVQDTCGIIITVGFLMGDATAEAAKANPDENFAIVDNAPEKPIDNVKPLLFDTAQAAYLGGYLAAGMSTTGVVGTFGGIPIPPVTIFMDGFVQGVDKYNQDNGTTVKVLGWDFAKQNGTFTGDFDDQNKGKQVTQNFIDKGADIIFPVAGPVGLGAAAAAKDAGNVRMIWVDSDGYETAPEYSDLFISSVLKEIGASTLAVTQETLDSQYSNTPYVGTLENGGVGLAPYHDFESQVPADLTSAIEALKQQIIDGSVVVESPASP